MFNFLSKSTENVQTIDVNRLQRWLAKGEPITIVDIRRNEDWKTWNIPGSINLNQDELSEPNAHLKSDHPVVTVCYRGMSSKKAADQLKKSGFEAYSLEGGMNGWSQAWNSADFEVPGSSTKIIQVRRAGRGCLSYMINSGNEAIVVDASIDPTIYIDLAKERGWNITHVFDTHIHADHISRSKKLSEIINAKLHLPASAEVSYQFIPFHDTEGLTVGSTKLTALHTPGHTDESTSYLVDGKALLTGDTLFLTGAGRPDLGASYEKTQERAHQLFHSLARLKKDVPESFIMASHTGTPPAFDHKVIGDSLDKVAETNQLLKLDEDKFVERMLEHIPSAPSQYETIVQLNKAGIFSEDLLDTLEAGANKCAAS